MSNKPLRSPGGSTLNATILTLIAALSTCVLCGLYMQAMAASSRLELPSERGMHTVAVPSGAGVAIVTVALLLWPFSHAFALEKIHLVVLAVVAGLMAISWMDDQYRLSPAVRLFAHTLAVALLLTALDSSLRVLPAVPLFVERVLLGVAWLWLINLFNFMDGIDGLAGCEAIAIAAGYVAVVTLAAIDTQMRELALIIAAASGGYLVWNWHPAKVFMGDAGSIPLGYLLGWLMIDLSCRGHWAAAVILPLYFVADATLTLFKRLRQGEKPWQPHRQHFYQRAVLGGATPRAVVSRVNAANTLLIIAAVFSTRFPVTALIAAVAVVAALLINLWRLTRP